MPRKRRVSKRRADAIPDHHAFIWGHFEGELPRQAFEAAWPRFRRDVWLSTHVGAIPFAARDYDGLSEAGLRAVSALGDRVMRAAPRGHGDEVCRDAQCSCTRYVADAREQLVQDATDLRAFQETPAGAEIADVLDVLLARLQQIDAALRDLPGSSLFVVPSTTMCLVSDKLTYEAALDGAPVEGTDDAA